MVLCILFVCLFHIQDVMNSLKKPVLAIEGDDGHLIVFRKVQYSMHLLGIHYWVAPFTC